MTFEAKEQELKDAMAIAMNKKGHVYKKAAKEIGVSQSKLYRLLKNDTPMLYKDALAIMFYIEDAQKEAA